MEVKTIRTEFQIPAENMVSLRERIKKLNGRAKRLKCAPITMVEGASFKKAVRIQIGEDDYGNPIIGDAMVTYVNVVIEGESPKIPGFTFIGTIDHLPTGKNVLRIIQGFNAEERFREIAQICEHCATKRNRKDTYIVQDDAGVQKQIGRNCLKDFTGHASPEKIASMAELLAEFLGEMGGFSEIGGGQDRFGVNLEEHLAWASFSIRKYGWTSGKAAYEFHTVSTNGSIGSLKSAYRKSGEIEDIYTDKDIAVAKEVIAWVRGVDATGSDYLQNLKAIFEMDNIEQRSTGLAVSAVPQYHRALEKEMEEKKRISQKGSKHIGEIGKRTIFTVTVLGISHVDSQFGTMNIHRMITGEGNVLVAFSMPEDLTVGQEYAIKATVKRHDVFKEISQTVVNRPKIIK